MSADNQQDTTAGAPKKRRWYWPLLIISLGLNLLVAGLVAGHFWTHGYGGHTGTRDRIFTSAVEALIKDLPDAKRQNASKLLKRHRASVRQLRKQIGRERRAAKDAILTDPYDEARVVEAFARFREIRNGQHQSMHTMMIGLLKDLTLKERRELLNNIRAGFRHRRGYGRHHEERPREGPSRRPPQ